VLPLYPALALLTAAALLEGLQPRWAQWLCAVIWLVVTLALAAALIVTPIDFGHSIMVTGIVGAIIVIVLSAVLLWRRRAPAITAALLAAISLGFVVPATGFVVPSLDGLWLSRSVAALVANHPPAPGTTLTVIGYNEPSLVFLLNGALKSGTADAAVAAGDKSLVSDREAQAFVQNLASRGLTAQPIDSAHGIDYSNGQKMTLTLYQIVPR
jgi:hypothetical protein